MRSRLEPIKAAARIIDCRLHNILIYCRNQLTNAVGKGLERKFMAIEHRTGGKRNVGNFNAVIYFYYGSLPLYP